MVSYNHYFGWYGGDSFMNGLWFDQFHETRPNTPIGCSEYGCEALNRHTSDPKQGDCIEEYQTFYHGELSRVCKSVLRKVSSVKAPDEQIFPFGDRYGYPTSDGFRVKDELYPHPSLLAQKSPRKIVKPVYLFSVNCMVS